MEGINASFKYEYVYLCRPEEVPALAAGLATYFGYYNERRSHQSLEHRTPAEAYGRGARSGKGRRAF